jgi:pilus assembly protein TadC
MAGSAVAHFGVADLLALAAFVGPGRVGVLVRLTALRRGDTTAGTAARTVRPGLRPLPIGAALASAALMITVGGWPGAALPGVVTAAVVWLAIGGVTRHRAKAADPVDPLLLASGWDLLAACLRGGLAVPDAVRAIAGGVPGETANTLRRTAELIALGADPVTAWAPALRHPATAELARGARRTARSGAALAGVAEALAADVRANAGELAEARAQRAAVAVTGPLGLCFLPAFLCLGVVPVVIGLATRLMASW